MRERTTNLGQERHNLTVLLTTFVDLKNCIYAFIKPIQWISLFKFKQRPGHPLVRLLHKICSRPGLLLLLAFCSAVRLKLVPKSLDNWFGQLDGSNYYLTPTLTSGKAWKVNWQEFFWHLFTTWEPAWQEGGKWSLAAGIYKSNETHMGGKVHQLCTCIQRKIEFD